MIQSQESYREPNQIYNENPFERTSPRNPVDHSGNPT